jgi:hypothetical protein
VAGKFLPAERKGNQVMKRLIAAVSFAAITVPALAAGLPYEQAQLDRALPNVTERKVDVQTSRFGAPYEQSAVDRALPNLEPQRTRVAEFKGDTRSDLEIAGGERAEPVWENDHNFIAPAQ